MGIPAYATTQRKFFTRGRVADMQRAFFACKLHCLRPDRALWQVWLGYVGYALEVVVTGVAEVSGAETEENGHGATVPAFVFLKFKLFDK